MVYVLFRYNIDNGNAPNKVPLRIQNKMLFTRSGYSSVDISAERILFGAGYQYCIMGNGIRDEEVDNGLAAITEKGSAEDV
jgi:hypothetical protein